MELFEAKERGRCRPRKALSCWRHPSLDDGVGSGEERRAGGLAGFLEGADHLPADLAGIPG
ncbi:hypothetical protein, partial [Escherichia coli]|uniref:hypothetical protein n=1 Tax=Escherichia coli TaxID=562 RepID=UPI00390C7550